MIDSSRRVGRDGSPRAAPGWDKNSAGNCEDDPDTMCRSLKEVLQLKLQQRRTREQLVDQGIMPPLKSPAAFYEQRKSLERARTEDYLKHKIRSRPERSELVKMHILEDTSVEPSLQARQLKLKRARLADDLNEKIAQRPGPMELVEKNILPVDSTLKEAMKVVQVEYPKSSDDFTYPDEDSSDVPSPEQPASQESQSSVPSPPDLPQPELFSLTASATIQYRPQVIGLNEWVNATIPTVTLQQHSPSPPPPLLPPPPLPPPLPLPPPQPRLPFTSATLFRAPLCGQAAPLQVNLATKSLSSIKSRGQSDKSLRSKKQKEPKSKVKKLKYHQYIPPDQKTDQAPPSMDIAYSRLLQQQQLFLQLQIMTQQQQHYNYQTILPALPKSHGDQQVNGCLSAGPLSIRSSTLAPTPPPAKPSQTGASTPTHLPLPPPKPLPSNLEDLKVAELKQELKSRGLPVSGTKPTLVERLKPFQDPTYVPITSTTTVATSPSSTTGICDTASTVPLNGSTESSTTGVCSSLQAITVSVAVPYLNQNSCPASPAPSEQSLMSTEFGSFSDHFSDFPMSPNTSCSGSTLVGQPGGDDGLAQAVTSMTAAMVTVLECEDVGGKDKMLMEKQRKIEELTRLIEMEQRQMDEIRMQIEREKNCQSNATGPPVSQGIFNKTSESLSEEPIKQESLLQPQLQSEYLGIKQECQVLSSCLSQSHGPLLGRRVAGSDTNLSGLVSQAQPLFTLGPDAAGTPPLLPLALFSVQQRLVEHGCPREQQAVVEQGSTNGCNLLAAPRIVLQGLKPSSQSLSMTSPTTTQTTSSCSFVSPLRQPTSHQIVIPQSTQLCRPQRHRLSAIAPSPANVVFSCPTAPPSLQPFFSSEGAAYRGESPPNGRLPAKSLSVPDSLHQAEFLGIQKRNRFPHVAAVPKAKQLPSYEDAVLQTKCQQPVSRSQQMDDVLDLLIANGEMPPQAKEEPPPTPKITMTTGALSTLSTLPCLSEASPTTHVSSGVTVSSASSSQRTLSPSRGDFQLGALCNDSTNHPPSLPLFKIDPDGDLNSFAILDEFGVAASHGNSGVVAGSLLDPMESPLSPMDTGQVVLLLGDDGLDMEWADLGLQNSASGMTPLGSAGSSSLFSTDFLDSDLGLNTPTDLIF